MKSFAGEQENLELNPVPDGKCSLKNHDMYTKIFVVSKRYGLTPKMLVIRGVFPARLPPLPACQGPPEPPPAGDAAPASSQLCYQGNGGV